MTNITDPTCRTVHDMSDKAKLVYKLRKKGHVAKHASILMEETTVCIVIHTATACANVMVKRLTAPGFADSLSARSA